MSAGQFDASSTSTPPLSIEQFHPNESASPASVGVCLSGGGSRALTAGMGQLQALNFLTVNASSMLSQVRAISTVSGGSWLGVPFEFLPPNGPADSSFLGVFNPNIGSVTLDKLAILPPGNAAAPITDTIFSPLLLAVQAVILYNALNVPANMLWQVIIGLNILFPLDLYNPGSDLAPTDLFSYNSQTLSRDVTGPNPSLANESAALVASGDTRTGRPILICNMAMLINESGTQVESLAPVQATPFITGIIGSPNGTDQNGDAVGGGGITSFAFNSTLSKVTGSSVGVSQTRQWSLTDIAGTSSAFFAEVLQDQIAQWKRNPVDFFNTLLEFGKEILEWIERHLLGEYRAQAKAYVYQNTAAPATAGVSLTLPNPQDMIPQYNYWSVANPKVVSNPQPTRFADAGSLDNTGVNGLLAYSDIRSVVSFINSEQPLVQGQYGVSDGKGGFLPNTHVIVSGDIPPLFGYQPYGTGQVNECNKGYVLYAGATCVDDDAVACVHNQVFESSAFPALLQGLWAAANNRGSNSGPAVWTQVLTLQPNKWFGITGGNSVTVAWCYLNYAQPWAHLFANNAAVANFIVKDVSQNRFPNYSTFDTNLSATQVNLMSNLAAWSVVAAEQENQTFSSLF